MSGGGQARGWRLCESEAREAESGEWESLTWTTAAVVRRSVEESLSRPPPPLSLAASSTEDMDPVQPSTVLPSERGRGGVTVSWRVSARGEAGTGVEGPRALVTAGGAAREAGGGGGGGRGDGEAVVGQLRQGRPIGARRGRQSKRAARLRPMHFVS